jgi:DASS family divalent anion:Na+ symporter
MKRESSRVLAWALTMCAPLLIFVYLSGQGADRHTALFSAITGTTLLMWAFSLLADFIPALLAMLALLLFGLAPEQVVLSGFSSSGFLLAFSILGLGVVVVESGLTRRYTLLLLAHLPANTFAHQVAVFMTGLLFTPTVPTIVGRAAIIGPVINHIAEGWDEKTRRQSSTMLYTTGLDSIHYLAPWFLTAAPANLMIYALLPPQEQQAFHFLFWAYAASLTSIILLLSYFLVSAVFFRRAYVKVDISVTLIRQELARLGAMSATERTALFGVLLLGLGIVSAPLHRIEIHYVAFAVLCLLLYLGALSRSDFIGKIDWAFLSLLASLIGILATMHYLKIDNAIIERLFWLGSYMRQDFPQFVLALSAVLLLVRLLVPLNQAIVIFAAALIPIAGNAGIAPWVVGFIILVIAETAFFPYQSPYIFLFDKINRVEYRLRDVQLFHGILIIFKLIAIYLSIPFWRYIGVL